MSQKYQNKLYFYKHVYVMDGLIKYTILRFISVRIYTKLFFTPWILQEKSETFTEF